jgi:hypothetical protein
MLVANLWLTPFFLAKLGPHHFGLWVVAGQLLNYLALLDLGIVGLLPRDVAASRGLQDSSPADTRRVVTRAFRIALLQMPLVAVGSIALWLLLPPHRKLWMELGGRDPRCGGVVSR